MKKAVKIHNSKKIVGQSGMERPTVSQLDRELDRMDSNSRFRRSILSVIYALIVVAAVALIVATTYVKVLRVYGSSMEPTLEPKEIVIGTVGNNYKYGDIIAFYKNNSILVKRVIGLPGDKVVIDSNGNVYVNDQLLDEPYISELALGYCDIVFPVYVGDNELFVLGDNRSSALDSRASEIGNVSYDDIVCKASFRIWPFAKFGTI